MRISRTGSLTSGWCVRNSVGFHRRTLLSAKVPLLAAFVACSPSEHQRSDTAIAQRATTESLTERTLADTLATVCKSSGRRGSVLVAKLDPEEAESGITFKLLGDGAGPGVVLCRDTLYADAAALLGLMEDSASVSESQGRALIDAKATQIPAYRHQGVLYVAVAPFARQRRALFLPSPDHAMDATVWPRVTLLHLEKSGNTRGRAYKAAVREGLLR